jgi:stage II sporulation protein D
VTSAGRTCLVLIGLAATACARPPSEPVVQPGGEQPDIRIGLDVGASEVVITGDGPIAASAAGRPAFRIGRDDAVTLRVDGRALLARRAAGTERFERLSFVSLAPDHAVMVDGRPYRGVIEAFVIEGGVTVVNVLALEAYLAGVVNVEMGRRTARERAALEAQAIVARTYALKNMGKSAGAGFDLRAGVSDQAYGGQARETDDGVAAVRATAGQVLVYDGDLIAPFYHSTCGGATAAPEEAFQSVRSTPYLRPVSDRHRDGFYCDISPRFQWTVEWDGEALLRILRRTVPGRLGIEPSLLRTIRDVQQRRTGPSGRVTEMRIRVDDGDVPVFGPDIRAVLRTPDDRMLGSTVVRIATERRDGVVARLTVDGRGWGHGVGMCQWGAIGRARAGQRARDILEAYFPGARVAHWY